jgi:hypothetical protein
MSDIEHACANRSQLFDTAKPETYNPQLRPVLRTYS